jgi:hypothetical protein
VQAGKYYGLTITDNQLSSGAIGILCLGGGGNWTIARNTVYQPTQYGIDVAPNLAATSNINILDNIIHDCSYGSAGVYSAIFIAHANATRVRISQNQCVDDQSTKTMKYGVHCTAGTDLREWDNTITGYTDGRVSGTFSSGSVVATANLPAASADLNGLMLVEDAGAGDQNIIIYGNSQRFRIDGGAAF